MTREHAKQLLPIITAYANGEEVQYNAGTESEPEWVTPDELMFLGNFIEYRVKPKPREFYLEIRDALPCGVGAATKAGTGFEKEWEVTGEIIKVREIIEP